MDRTDTSRMDGNTQAPQDMRFSLRALLIFVTAIALLLGLIGSLNRRAAIQKSELERLTKLDEVTRKEIVKVVEEVRTKLGRPLKDQEELETLMGKPMPFAHCTDTDGYPMPIQYHRRGDNSYCLVYTVEMYTDWCYDSDNPTAGWQKHID